MNALALVLTAGAFAAAGWLGAALAARLYAGAAPFADGPAAVPVPRALFAVAGGLLGVAVGLHAPDAPLVVLLGLMTLVLGACAYADVHWGIVPDAFSLPALALLAVVALGRHMPAPLFGAVLIGVPFAVLALGSRGRGMGWGDVKLAALGGALLGAADAVLAVCAACIAAVAVATVTRRADKPLALAPYLAVSVAVAMGLDPAGAWAS